jgi:hypothetical protein
LRRPRYETKKDLDNELEIATAFAAGHQLEKLPVNDYSADYQILRDSNPVAIVEVKDRPGWKKHFPDVILSLAKAEMLLDWTNKGIPAFFVARLCGDIYYVKVDNRMSNWKRKIAGRKDRGDPADLEECVHIPINDFTRKN